ncbi:MAG TPA: hypothetical protein VIW64_04195 [Pyrinomonadaceae bacterium]|jgi:hypothetical protein
MTMRDAVTNERLAKLLSELTSLTGKGDLHWERQLGSAHRYARWKNNLIILGPAEPLSETKIPRYLFLTPFDSPACIEINSEDPELSEPLLELVALVEKLSKQEPPTDPFTLNPEELNHLLS